MIASPALLPALMPSQKSGPSKPGETRASAPEIAAEIFQDLPYQGTPAQLPEDQGAKGLRQMLRRLNTTGRLMQTVAHPDDEDGGMLTLESRGHGDQVLLMTLNRGEGGQNKVGSNLSDVLGVLRSLELLAADEYYGVQERFSRVADFGFSKSADETFSKWGGHDAALADMVRVIRTFHPDVLVARFSGTDRDGHGHHQASSILTKEAFRAAADPKRFPSQITEGLLPWQAKKLYIGNVCGFGAMTCPDADWTVKLNTGETNPDLGGSYVQFAMRGLRHQLSQGAANWNVEPGDRFTFYKLIDSIEPPKSDSKGHEKDFFDGIDTSLTGLASALGSQQNKLPKFRSVLEKVAQQLRDTSKKANAGDDIAAARSLGVIAQELNELSKEASESKLTPILKGNLAARLKEKYQEAQQALNDALNVSLTATVSARAEPSKTLPHGTDLTATVSPGQEFLIAVDLHNFSSESLIINSLKLQVPPGWGTISDKTKPVAAKPGEDVHVVFRLRVPKDAPYTKPYWHRDDPDKESVNHIDGEKYATLPFLPPLLRASADYSLAPSTNFAAAQVKSTVSATVTAAFTNEEGKTLARPLAVVPAFSVALEPGTQVISTHNGASTIVKVGITSNLTRAAHGTLHLELPEGWRSEPSQVLADLNAQGEKKDYEFKVFPANLQQSRAQISAVFEVEGGRFTEGYSLVTRDDLGSFFYYQPARQRVNIVDVQVPRDLKIGYIMGAGDDIPTVLQQIGMNVNPIPADQLAVENLQAYDTIVLGIRAYDTQKNVVANNPKLLDFVSAGGTLVVQYNASVADFNSAHLTPYSADLSRNRVSVEEAPVELLQPADDIFHYPNTIDAHDFENWVQERGLYFMDKWDEHFQPLLSCHDPGESAQQGGLLEASYGKGTYIYTGFAFFRQLPAGVPGAVRLYVNLLSAGHDKAK